MRKDAHDDGDGGKDADDFTLAPAAHFKMMMDWRHLKQAPSMRCFKIGYLQNDRQRLADINQTDRQQHQRHIARKCQTCHSAAKKERTGIAHKDLGRVKVENQETEQRTGERARKRHDARILLAISDRCKKDCDRHGHTRRKPVNAIGEVHSIVAADHHNNRKHEVHYPRQPSVMFSPGIHNPELSPPVSRSSDRNTAATTICSSSFCIGVRPAFCFFLIFAQSSIMPTKP